MKVTGRTLVASLLLLAGCRGPGGAGADSPRAYPNCPSEAGCGPSVYGVATIGTCDGDPHPVTGGLVVAYRDNGSLGTILDNWDLTDTDGAYAIPLVANSHYQLALASSQSQDTVGPGAGRRSQFRRFDTADVPVHVDLMARIGCY